MLPLYTLLKVVNYYDLNVLSKSVMGFQKKSLDGGLNGWGETYPVLFWIFGIIFNFANPFIRDLLRLKYTK